MRTKNLRRLALFFWFLTVLTPITCWWMLEQNQAKVAATAVFFLGMVTFGTLGSHYWERYKKRLERRARE